jgi:hypothetical protein
MQEPMVRGSHEQAGVVQWGRSYEISKKSSKKNEFQFLIFKVRLKYKWKEKVLFKDIKYLNSRAKERNF